MPVPPSIPDSKLAIKPGEEDGRADGKQVMVVMITTPGDEVAKDLATKLLAQELIACANLIPKIQSIYQWQGETQVDTETLMLCKTTSDKLEAVTRVVCREHPYDEPEVVGLNIQGGSRGYLDWVRGCTGMGGSWAGGGRGPGCEK